MKVRIDGVQYDVTEQAAQAIQKEQSRHDGEKIEFEQKLDAATKAQSEAKGRADAAEAKLKEVEKERDDALDPEKVRAVAKARATLESEAASILGDDFKLDELSDSAIRKEVVSYVMGDRFNAKDVDDSYIEGAYRVAVDQAKDAKRSRNDIADAASHAGTALGAQTGRQGTFPGQTCGFHLERTRFISLNRRSRGPWVLWGDPES